MESCILARRDLSSSSRIRREISRSSAILVASLLLADSSSNMRSVSRTAPLALDISACVSRRLSDNWRERVVVSEHWRRNVAISFSNDAMRSTGVVNAVTRERLKGLFAGGTFCPSSTPSSESPIDLISASSSSPLLRVEDTWHVRKDLSSPASGRILVDGASDIFVFFAAWRGVLFFLGAGRSSSASSFCAWRPRLRGRFSPEGALRLHVQYEPKPGSVHGRSWISNRRLRERWCLTDCYQGASDGFLWAHEPTYLPSYTGVFVVRILVLHRSINFTNRQLSTGTS